MEQAWNIAWWLRGAGCGTHRLAKGVEGAAAVACVVEVEGGG
ncbi:hypothetical protein SAMN05216355_1304, partial [Actinomyces ruminicola]